MNTLTLIPGLPFDCLQIMDLLIQVEQKLAGNESLIALSVKYAIQKGTPARVILKEIQMMAEDNRTVIEDIVGVEITGKIMEI